MSDVTYGTRDDGDLVNGPRDFLLGNISPSILRGPAMLRGRGI